MLVRTKLLLAIVSILLSSSSVISQDIFKTFNDRVWQGEMDSVFRNNGVFVDDDFSVSDGDTLTEFMFFLPGNKIYLNLCRTKESYIDYRLATNDVYDRYGSLCNCWGNYEIKDGVITARVFIRYMNKGLPRWILKPTYYSGNLEGDSIVNWRLIPPYPKVFGFNDKDTTEQTTFRFVRSDLPAKIDANKVWLYNLKK